MTKIDKYTQLFWKSFAWGIVALLVWGLSGCYTQRTAERQTDKAHHKYPLVGAKFCSSVYPCLDSVHEIVRYLQGEEIVFIDTLVEYHETKDTVTIVKYLTKTITRIDTVDKSKFEAQTDKAERGVCDEEKKALNETITKQKERIAALDQSNKSKGNWLMWIGIAAVVVVVWKLAKGYVSKWIPKLK